MTINNQNRHNTHKAVQDYHSAADSYNKNEHEKHGVIKDINERVIELIYELRGGPDAKLEELRKKRASSGQNAIDTSGNMLKADKNKNDRFDTEVESHHKEFTKA